MHPEPILTFPSLASRFRVCLEAGVIQLKFTFIHDDEVRNRIGGQRRQLARWDFFANQGEFRENFEEIMNKSSCLSCSRMPSSSGTQSRCRESSISSGRREKSFQIVISRTSRRLRSRHSERYLRVDADGESAILALGRWPHNQRYLQSSCRFNDKTSPLVDSHFICSTKDAYLRIGNGTAVRPIIVGN